MKKSNFHKQIYRFIPVLIFCLVPICFAWKLLSPSDKVQVDICPLPQGEIVYCILVKNGDAIEPLSFYHTKVIASSYMPFIGDPPIGGFRSNKIDGTTKFTVQWNTGEEYGILVRTELNSWQIYWLNTSQLIKPNLIGFLTSSGKATVKSIPRMSPESVPQSLLRLLGIVQNK